MSLLRDTVSRYRLRRHPTGGWAPEEVTGDGWEPEEATGGGWSPVGRASRRQFDGPVAGKGRNANLGVAEAHENRAGHRQHVRALQTRQVRRNVVGFGRWRRHNERTEESWAAQTAIPQIAPRSERRAAMKRAYRTARNVRLGR